MMSTGAREEESMRLFMKVAHKGSEEPEIPQPAENRGKSDLKAIEFRHDMEPDTAHWRGQMREPELPGDEQRRHVRQEILLWTLRHNDELVKNSGWVGAHKGLARKI